MALTLLWLWKNWKGWGWGGEIIFKRGFLVQWVRTKENLWNGVDVVMAWKDWKGWGGEGR